MPGTFEPVEDVSAAGVVDLVEGMSVRLLHRHCIAAETEREVTFTFTARNVETAPQ